MKVKIRDFITQNKDLENKLLKKLKIWQFYLCWGQNPGFCIYYTGILPLSYIPSPTQALLTSTYIILKHWQKKLICISSPEPHYILQGQGKRLTTVITRIPCLTKFKAKTQVLSPLGWYWSSGAQSAWGTPLGLPHPPRRAPGHWARKWVAQGHSLEVRSAGSHFVWPVGNEQLHQAPPQNEGPQLAWCCQSSNLRIPDSLYLWKETQGKHIN